MQSKRNLVSSWSLSHYALVVAFGLFFLAGCAAGEEAVEPSDGATADGAQAAASDVAYWVYVGAESADKIHRIRFDGEEASVELTTPVGELFNKMEGPHGLAVTSDQKYLFMTTGHGFPDGKLWKFELGEDETEPIEDPIDLGRFPATVDVTPDDNYVFIVNFNLHGEMVPSTVSVVDAHEFEEVTQTEVGVMPHGSRISPDGDYQYTGLMMDDEIVQLSTSSFEVEQRFDVSVGNEGPVTAHDGHASHSGEHGSRDHDPTCSPTWAQPSADGAHVYVACNANDTVLEIDTEAWELTRTFETGEGPYNIDVSPNNELLVVTLKQGDGVEFIDLASGERLAQRNSSTTVTHGVVVSPDNRYAFVSVEGVGAEPGKVDVYELESFERVDSVETGQQASGIDFWKMEELE